ncbi:MAG: cache domain-containing protein [Anaerolineales bacterium]
MKLEWFSSLQAFKGSLGRLVAAFAIILAGYALLLSFFLNSYSERLVAAQRSELQRIVDLGLNELEPLRDEELTHPFFSREQTRREAAIRLRELTYRYRLGENFLFMGTLEGVILVDPYRTEMEFTDQSHLTDSNGKAFVQEMIQLAASPAGSGFLEYEYPSPGEQDPVPRMAYVVGIPEWQVYIGAGMSLDNVHREARRYWLTSSLLAAGLVLAVISLVMLTISPIAGSYRQLQRLFSEIRARPDYTPKVPKDSFKKGSEAWELLDNFESMLVRLEETEQARREAVLHERNRLARELHDAVSQTLFSASLTAEALPALLGKKQEVAMEKAKGLSNLIQGALAEMRNLLLELRPYALEHTDIQVLLEQLAAALGSQQHLSVKTDLQPVRLSMDAKLAFYRIAQEAINNIRKHAEASLVTLILHRNSSYVILTVQDDGKGFEPSQTSKGRLGLSIMQERAEAVGAELVIQSSPDKGTRLTLRWPLDTQSHSIQPSG